MKTIAKWYPGEGEITYGEKEFEENPARTCRRTPKLTELGEQVWELISEVLRKNGFGELKRRWNRKCGCPCGCSPGYRINANAHADTFVFVSHDGALQFSMR